MKKIKIKWLIFCCAMLILHVLPAQNIGDPVQIKFTNARQDSRIIVKVWNEDERGRRSLVKEDTINKNGRLLVDLNVGNIVFGELENSTATTRPIYINGSFRNQETFKLDPRVSFMDFSQARHKDGQINRYLNTAASLYGVDAGLFVPRDITGSFKTEEPIFQGLADENTVTYGLQNGGYVLPGGQDLTLVPPKEEGVDIVNKSVGVRDFMEKWNAGLAGTFPLPNAPDLAIKASIAYGQKHIKKSKETDVFYLIEKEGESYQVAMNLEKVVFNDQFISDLSMVDSEVKATAFIKKYGSHYPKTITYGGMYSQYTIVKETDYYKADIDELDLTLGITSTKPGTQTSTFKPARPAIPAGGPTGNPGKDATTDSWETSGNPNSSSSTPLEVTFTRQTKQEIRDIVKKSETYYRAVGGFINGSNNFAVDQNASPIKVTLGEIMDLVDARILKSRLTPSQVAEIKPHIVKAFETYIRSLNKPIKFDRKVRTIRFRIDEIRVTEHIDDLDRGCFGTLTASITGDNIITPKSFPIFNVEQTQKDLGIYTEGVINPIGNDQENGFWKWHFIKQEANTDGTFPPISLKIVGQIVESDHVGPWEYSKPRDVNRNMILDGTLQLEKFPFHGWEDFLGAHAQPFDLDVKIRAIGVLGMGFKGVNAHKSAVTSSAKVPGVIITPVESTGMTKTEFEKYALGTPAVVTTPPSTTTAAGSNLALNKATKQSSTFGNNTANYAVDGNTKDRHSGAMFTTTQSDTNAWWEVDLGANYDISQINIFNVTDHFKSRLQNLNIKVSTTPFTRNEDGQAFATNVFPDPVGNYKGNTTGRYVRVYIGRKDYLNICEVQVMGTPAKNIPKDALFDLNATYKITDAKHNKSLVTGMAYGGGVYHQTPRNSPVDASWYFIPTGDGYYYIYDHLFNKALTGPDEYYGQGAYFIHHQDPNGRTNAQWKITPSGIAGKYIITDRKHNNAMVAADVADNNLYSQPHNNRMNAYWSFQVTKDKAPTVKPDPNEIIAVKPTTPHVPIKKPIQTINPDIPWLRTEYVRIQNKMDNTHYLYYENGDIVQGPIQEDWLNAQWKFMQTGSSTTSGNLQLRSNPELYLKNNEGKLELVKNPNPQYGNVQWSITTSTDGEWAYIYSYAYGSNKGINVNDGKVQLGDVVSNQPSGMWKVELSPISGSGIVTTPPTTTTTATVPALVNVALNKKTKQISTTSNFVSGHAVDGNTKDQVFGAPVSSTLKEENAWWEVDLGANYNINQINVFNVTAYYKTSLKGLNIRVSKTPFTKNEDGQAFASNVFPDIEGNYKGNATGRYVRLYINRKDALWLCEVQVMGTPE